MLASAFLFSGREAKRTPAHPDAGDGEGIGGALTKRSEDVPALVFYIAVEDVVAALASVEGAGGRRLTARMPIPTVGWSAFFEDTEAHKVGLFQSDPSVPMLEGMR